ncbi:hypothetical protein [Formosa sp. S-31]|uniref:hypothetical protein n=1 Tax=Formosa sp. S-31 TaxID=2790949 RepID=UPI003EBB61E7
MFTATTDQITEWKDKFGDVIRIKSKKYDKSAYYRKPTRTEMEYLSSGNQTSGLKFNAALLKACYLDGDKEIETKDDIFMGIGEEIMALLTFDEVEVEKL